MFPVFGGGAHHGRAADVNVFNRVFQRAACFGDGGGKGVEIDAHKVNIADAVFRHLRGVVAQIAPPEYAAVDFRVQGFDAAVQHFGKARVVRHFNHGDADIGKQLGGAACG